VPAEWTAGWSKLPGFLINIVFACLLMGVTVPSIGTLWRRSGPQLAYGQIVAWGQYAVGVGLFLAVIKYAWPHLPVMFGGVLPVGFEGGHGTASGMASVFATYGWEAGKDFALASATAGIVGAVVVGMILVNWAARKGYVKGATRIDELPPEERSGIVPESKRASAGSVTISPGVIGTLSFHLMVIGFAILIGWGLRSGLRYLSALTGNATFIDIMRGFPLFPLCMLGGLAIQVLAQRYDTHKLIDGGVTKLIMNAALDFLVVAAIATIRVEVLREGLVAFLALVAAGILWNVFCVTWLARRLLPDAWFERSIAEMGQSMGVTATGVLLLRVVDPEYETPAAEAFAFKQLLHEPFMGGGLWTSTAIPLLALWGGWPVFGIAAGALVAWFVVAVVLKKRRA
jgi:ESS family glutamate:Na+ symporter